MTQERRNLARTEGLRPSLVAICRDGSATAEAVIKCITEGDNPNAIQKNKISPGLGNSSRNEWTPIQLASISCPASVVAALAGSGAKISLDSSELVLAALNNDHDGVIPSLIRAGANPDASDHQGETVLSRVIRLARSNEELDRLVRNPCHLPTLDPKTLEIAYEARSSVSLVRNLLSAALPISNSGSSSLLERITWDFEEDRSGRRNSYLVALFNVLISHKFITDSSTSSPLELAIARVTSTHLFLQSVLTKRTNQEDPEIFKDLLWRILDSVDDDNGDRSGPIKSIQAAIVSGCNRTIPNAAGDTPLHCACEKFASEDIADLLGLS